MIAACVRARYRYRHDLTVRSDEVFGTNPAAGVASWSPEYGFTYPKGEFESTWWQVWLIRDGKVHYVRHVARPDELDEVVAWVRA